jgi:hypothetical protein
VGVSEWALAGASTLLPPVYLSEKARIPIVSQYTDHRATTPQFPPLGIVRRLPAKF